MQMWNDSGLEFNYFVMPGDEVDKELVDYFLSFVPVINNNGLLQCGDACQHIYADGKYLGTTYTSFKFDNGKWFFVGECFPGGKTSIDTEKGVNTITAIEENIEYLEKIDISKLPF